MTGELLLRSEGYSGDFALKRAGQWIEAGALELAGPIPDADHDSLPDHLVLERAATLLLQGSATSFRPVDTPPQTTRHFTVTARFSRAAGEINGTYELTFTSLSLTEPDTFSMTGQWSLVGFDAADSRLIYQNDKNYRLELTELGSGRRFTGGPSGYGGRDADHVQLELLTLSDNQGNQIRLDTTALMRTGNRYVGLTTFSPPFTATGQPIAAAWMGYQDWYVEVTDPNDTDGNGVPELSDQTRFSTRVTIIREGMSPEAVIGGSMIFRTIAGGRQARYQWYRDGLPLWGQTGATLVLNPVLPSGVSPRAVIAVLATTDTGATASDSFTFYLKLPPSTSGPAPVIPPGALVPSSGPFSTVFVGPNPIVFYNKLPGAVHLELQGRPAVLGGGEITLIWRADFARPASTAGVTLRLRNLGGGQLAELTLADPAGTVLATASPAMDGTLSIDDDGQEIVVSQQGVYICSARSPARLGGSVGLLGAPSISAPQFCSYGALWITAGDGSSWLIPRGIARVLDISTRGQLDAENALTAGVVLNPTNSGALLARAVGPGLRAFGVTDAAVQSKIDVYQSATLLATNAGWSGADNAAQITAMGSSVGAFPLASGDAAVLRSYGAGAYTFSVSGSGSALVEIFDAGSPVDSSVFFNLSTRGFVSAAQPMIAGFVITGGGTRTLMLRAIGPALRRFGVSNPLADPRLTLFDGSGRQMLANDSWSALADFSPLETIARRVGAFPLSTRIDDNEAILYVQLPAGNYTAQMTSADGASGVGLIEIYDVTDP